MNADSILVDKLASEVYEYCCAHRGDNTKNGKLGDPRNVGNGFDNLFDEPKNFYRDIARWHLYRNEQDFGLHQEFLK